MQQFYKDNSPLIKSLVMTSLLDSEILDEIKKRNLNKVVLTRILKFLNGLGGT
jgi:hypothetical protein